MALWLLLVACILDRTGQSGTSRYQQELMEVSQRVSSLELRADNAEMRVSQLEEVTRSRGHDEILQLENLDQIRGELARVRGDLEVLGHESEQAVEAKQAREEDVIFRLEWLESRATALEETLGVEPAATIAGVMPAESGGEAHGEAPAPTEESTEGESGAVEGESGDEGVAEVDEGADTGQSEEDLGAIRSVDKLMKLAEEHLLAGRERAAEAVLRRVLTEFEDHRRHAEARYRLAEAAFNSGDYGEAALRFQEVIDKHHESPWASWAMLRQGECFEEQGQEENARFFYEDVLRLWPKSKAAREAREKLD